MNIFLHRHQRSGTELHSSAASEPSKTLSAYRVSRAFPAVSSGAAAIGALAIGALSIGALAIGALAIGRLVIKRLFVGKSKIDSLEIGELKVGRLEVVESAGSGVVSKETDSE